MSKLILLNCSPIFRLHFITFNAFAQEIPQWGLSLYFAPNTSAFLQVAKKTAKLFIYICREKCLFANISQQESIWRKKEKQNNKINQITIKLL